MSELLRSVYETVLEHIQVCEERMKKVVAASDFVKSAEGELLLDAVSMRLQAIGENVKRILKLNPPIVDWESIVRFRDLISHHYEKLDYEVIFDIGKFQLPELKKAITSELGK